MTDFKLPVQVLHNGKWLDATVVYIFSKGRAVVVSSSAFDEVALTFDHRNGGIRNTPPTAVLVAFDRETVPKGALWRANDWGDDKWRELWGHDGKDESSNSSWFEILRYDIGGVSMGLFDQGRFDFSYQNLLEDCQYSTDNGATWHRAGRTP